MASTPVHAARRRFIERHGDGTHVHFLPGQSHPALLHGFRAAPPVDPGLAPPSGATGLEPSKLEAWRTARAFLEDVRGLLGISDGIRLELEAVRSIGDGTAGDGQGARVVRFLERFGDHRVLASSLTVFLDSRGRVTGVLSDLARDIRPENRVRIDAGAAASAARSRLASDRVLAGARVAGASTGLLRHAGSDRFVWDVALHVGGLPYRALVDAGDGTVIAFGCLLRSGECQPEPRADFYAMSPAHAGPERGPLDHIDCSSSVLSGEFIRSFHWLGTDPWTQVPLFRFDLQGSITPSGRLFSASSPDELAQTTVFRQATAFHDWFGEVGFEALDRPFPAVANAAECFGEIPCDNAYYDPLYGYATGTGIIVFGIGFGVNYGLDGDVICHEYTHAVVHETAGLGEDIWDPNVFYSAALNEAFADYFSCTFLGDPDLGEYSGASAGVVPMRTLDNGLVWPDDIDPVFYHDTGQIWGGALWDIRRSFSRDGLDLDGVRDADRLAYAP